MTFNFKGIKANLEGINSYLEFNGITLSEQDKENITSIFEKVDKTTYKENEQGYNDGVLDIVEQNSFMNLLPENFIKIKDAIVTFFSGTNKEQLDVNVSKKLVQQNDATAVTKSPNPRDLPSIERNTNHIISYTREDIYLIALDQCVKRTPELRKVQDSKTRINLAKKKYPSFINNNNQKANKVTNMVIKNCAEYNVPELTPVIVNILGNETGGFNFSAKVLNKKGIAGCPKGSMQTDLDTIAALYKDVKSSDAKFINKLKSKYATPKALYRAIQTDVELGLKVGILVFKQKLRKKGGNVKQAIRDYCGGSYKYDCKVKIPEKLDV